MSYFYLVNVVFAIDFVILTTVNPRLNAIYVALRFKSRRRAAPSIYPELVIHGHPSVKK